ncbi:MAG: TonB-dependent receptor, partial [Muribaculaceae bacterium]|nr:TonB-dependent receptor [Muribaculaceae bacterium]
RVYASVAVAQKEPTRNNYTDGLFLQHPRAERLTDWELGYEFKSSSFTAGVNFYYMNYKDQLVLNGKLNEIGELMAENVPHSYRLGMELTAAWRPVEWFTWSANATLSRNRIKDYVGYVSDYDATTWDDLYTQSAIECGNTTIAFSPSVIANNIFDFHVGGFEAQVTSQYVSRQYLDNFANREDSLDPFFVSNLNMAYTFKALGMKSITAGVAIYNLFDARYETNGYSQTCALIDSATGARQLYSDPRFYPMAGINLLAHIALKF